MVKALFDTNILLDQIKGIEAAWLDGPTPESA